MKDYCLSQFAQIQNSKFQQIEEYYKLLFLIFYYNQRNSSQQFENELEFYAFLLIILQDFQNFSYYSMIFVINSQNSSSSQIIYIGSPYTRQYFVQMMHKQRDILIFKGSKNQDLSILDISSGILNDSQFVETMKLVSE
ncbi:unnamed protein product [Paramecium pentaurelia]|uniref:Uncharacterized protein n=1 Tax=Paramecium pentaurelia TaxID=43138 RepID=A0A8S1YBF1_9CILI|nr:unnamed protein product [Paramecium pentaurelia]